MTSALGTLTESHPSKSGTPPPAVRWLWSVRPAGEGGDHQPNRRHLDAFALTRPECVGSLGIVGGAAIGVLWRINLELIV